MKKFLVVAISAALFSCAPSGPAYAPQMNAAAANQYSIASNACGPTALLNSLRSGDAGCQAAASRIPGETDRQKLRHLILKNCSNPSRHIPGRKRWSIRGINAIDLTDVVNEIHPSARVSFVHPAASGGTLCAGAHQQLARSLRAGFPPIVGVRRYVADMPVDSHYFTIIGVDAMTDANANSFTFSCIDPSGGKRLQGKVIQDPANPSSLIATIHGSRFERAGASGRTVMDAMILRR